MERRIKIIWLLSLTSMLLIGAGQGYWLWNHYQYTMMPTVARCCGRCPKPW